MRVVLTNTARHDLAAIAAFISQDNAARALTFVDELLDRCGDLVTMANRYPLIPRYERHGIRFCMHDNYLIFYRVSTGQG